MNERNDSPWPGDHAFALFLSHDIDNFYDREFFRFLGDVNHLRKVLLHVEQGDSLACMKRIARCLLSPTDPVESIEKIISIERSNGFRSTFYFLEDPVFNRYGGRYKYADDKVKEAVRMVVDSGCEAGVHGAYHAFNSVEGYRKQRKSFFEAFGFEPAGIRNHYLRHSGVDTWRAQRDAGYCYDASFGFNYRIGIREERAHPFFPIDNYDSKGSFVALPLDIMDSAVFRAMNLSLDEAFSAAKRVAEDVIGSNGLLSLSWHNNYFNEEEYIHWQLVYKALLDWLAKQHPWNATGAEIASWWRKNTRQ